MITLQSAETIIHFRTVFKLKMIKEIRVKLIRLSSKLEKATLLILLTNL